MYFDSLWWLFGRTSATLTSDISILYRFLFTYIIFWYFNEVFHKKKKKDVELWSMILRNMQYYLFDKMRY